MHSPQYYTVFILDYFTLHVSFTVDLQRTLLCCTVLYGDRGFADIKSSDIFIFTKESFKGKVKTIFFCEILMLLIYFYYVSFVHQTSITNKDYQIRILSP